MAFQRADQLKILNSIVLHFAFVSDIEPLGIPIMNQFYLALFEVGRSCRRGGKLGRDFASVVEIVIEMRGNDDRRAVCVCR